MTDYIMYFLTDRRREEGQELTAFIQEIQNILKTGSQEDVLTKIGILIYPQFTLATITLAYLGKCPLD